MINVASVIAPVVAQAIGPETKVPVLPSVTDANTSQVLRQVKHLLDVREGKVGDLMDANVTFRDLVKTGLAVKPSWSSPSFPVAPPGVYSDGYNPAIDYTPPAAPRNVTASGGIGVVILQWDTPAYRNHSYAEVWRAETNSLGNAVLLGTTDTRFYTDAVGAGVTRYYWVRFVSLANVTGPYQGVNGIQGTTGQDPAYLIELLQGQITAQELDSALTSRIDLIDAPASTANSVAARIAAEAALRVQAINTEQAARTSAIAQESASRAAAILQEAQDRQAAVDGLQAAILQEAITRQDGLTNEATARETLAVQMRGNYTGGDIDSVTSGLLFSERTARSTADSALSSQISVLSSTVTTNYNTLNAAIVSEQTTRATAISAEASARDTLATQLRGSYVGTDVTQVTTGLIHSERQSRITADEALQTQINTLSAASSGDFQELLAAIQEEQTARIAGDNASAASLSTLTARLNNVADGGGTPTNKSIEATLTDDRAARVSGDAALSGQITTLTSTVTNNFNTLNAAIQSEATTRSTAIAAESSARDTLSAQLRGSYTGTDIAQLTSGLLFSERQARSTADSALSTSITNLTATVSSNFGTLNSAITNEAVARASADTSEATARESLATQMRGSYAGTDVTQLTQGLLYNERQARTSADSALSTSITGLSATVTNNYNTLNAAIQTQQETISDAFNALTSEIVTLESSVVTNNNSLTAAIQQESSTRATVTGGLLAQFTVKTDLNGYISGFGLASTANNAAPTSEFQVRSDVFKIASPTGPGVAPATPFIVRTTPTTIGGVSVPVGVYLQDAFIANGTISNAKIANAAIDNAKIANLDAAKITTGFIDADRINAGSIDAKILSVSSAKITGLLTANQINGAGLAIMSGQYTGYNWPASGGGFYLGPQGLLLGRYSATQPSSTYLQFDAASGSIYANGFSIVNGAATFSGNLSAAGGTFSGSLSAASGTFAGTLQGALVRADNIISRSATSFEYLQVWAPNGSWKAVDFYMDHAGYCMVFSFGLWNQNGTGGSYEVFAGIGNYGAASPYTSTGATGSWYSSAAPNPPPTAIATYLSAGWHRAFCKLYISTATADHFSSISIFKSYR